jgi:hypothetical protein
VEKVENMRALGLAINNRWAYLPVEFRGIFMILKIEF